LLLLLPLQILGYDGPNIILIRVAGSGIVLGAYNEDNWKESNRFYGSPVSFLFTLLPHMHIFRSKATSNSNFQWLNLKVRKRGSEVFYHFIVTVINNYKIYCLCWYYLLWSPLTVAVAVVVAVALEWSSVNDCVCLWQSYGMPHGLGMGGDLEKFRLYLPDTLEGCVARNNCLTFETGSFFNDYRKGKGGEKEAGGNSTPGPEFDIGEHRGGERGDLSVCLC
jgi:hypothetical protein